MNPRLDIAGKHYGRLTILGFHSLDRFGKTLWLTRCSCGVEKVLAGSEIKRGNVKSCGCYMRDRIVKQNTKHGLWGISVYYIWIGMIRRCTNPKFKQWKDYGGRGIKVCERWMNLANFYADVGDKPIGKSIDRINNNGNYEPGNVRWATPKEQVKNARPRSSRRK